MTLMPRDSVRHTVRAVRYPLTALYTLAWLSIIVVLFLTR